MAGSSVEVPALRGESVINDRIRQVDLRRHQDRPAHETVQLTDSVGLVVRPRQNAHDPAAFGARHTLQRMIGEAVEDLKAARLEPRGVDGLLLGIGQIP
jgi:hypothetical protein